MILLKEENDDDDGVKKTSTNVKYQCYLPIKNEKKNLWVKQIQTSVISFQTIF